MPVGQFWNTHLPLESQGVSTTLTEVIRSLRKGYFKKNKNKNKSDRCHQKGWGELENEQKKNNRWAIGN